MVQLILLRHGQTFANVEGRWVGRGETELTPLGWQQAGRTAQRLAREVQDLAALYSSPLKRALDTATVIGRALGCLPVVIDDLREVDFGDMDGLTIAEMAERDPGLYARWLDKADSEFTWPGGDRRADFFRRVSSAFDGLLARHRSGTVIVVGHGGTIRACLAHLFPVELGQWWTYKLENCALTRVEVGEDGARLVALNDAAHLAEIAAEGESEKPSGES